MRSLLWLAPCLMMTALGTLQARAGVALLMEEPYGVFGGFNPTGHAAVYLDHICAESPTRLRMCEPGEAGVVISRYHRIHGYDWIAVPLVPYLYAVDRIEDVPSTVDARTVRRLRNDYRRKYLEQLVPDPHGEDDEAPRGEWYMLTGSSYDRKIYGLQLETTREADEDLIARFNDRRNIGHFNILFHNCADFARVLIDHYYPHAVHRNFIADFGMSTPQQDYRSLQSYGKRNADAGLTAFVIPQVAGSMPRSKPINGVAESVLKSKKYVVPLAILHPEVTAGLFVVYLTEGRFKTPKTSDAFVIPGATAAAGHTAPEPAATKSEPASETSGASTGAAAVSASSFGNSVAAAP